MAYTCSRATEKKNYYEVGRCYSGSSPLRCFPYEKLQSVQCLDGHRVKGFLVFYEISTISFIDYVWIQLNHESLVIKALRFMFSGGCSTNDEVLQ